jgi:hypothetical protein
VGQSIASDPALPGLGHAIPQTSAPRPATEIGVIESMLRNRYRFFAEIRDGVEVPNKVRAMLGSTVAFLGLYGAVIGSDHSLQQALSSGFKLPALFIVTLLVCLPTLHFFNVLFGANLSVRQNFALILTAITITSVLLLSFAPVVLFFMLTTSQYQFFKLLNVAVFALTGAIGVRFLSDGMKMVGVVDTEGVEARRGMLRAWILLYGFVGTQLAWTLRPFFGAPGMDFELFRDLGGNFYSNVFASFGELFGAVIVR